MLAIVLSSGSTSSQSMYRSGTPRPQPARDRPERALHPQPPDEPGRPDVDRHDPQLAIDLVEADVVDADDLAPLDVDDLLVQQVGLEQDLVLALAELGDVDRAHVQPGAVVAQRAGRCSQGRKIWRRSVRATRPVTGG